VKAAVLVLVLLVAARIHVTIAAAGLSACVPVAVFIFAAEGLAVAGLGWLAYRELRPHQQPRRWRTA
jgi:hypothetical protein